MMELTTDVPLRLAPITKTGERSRRSRSNDVLCRGNISRIRQMSALALIRAALTWLFINAPFDHSTENLS
jgi:hypothetical protein